MGRRRPVDYVHYGQHDPPNAGDRLLFPAVRRALAATAGLGTHRRRELFDELTLEDVRWINRHSSAVVVGGGGLFLRDTGPNKNSGWQWNAPMGVVSRIDRPLILYAIGYNRFRGQPEFDAVFAEHLTQVVEQAAFVGLRNRGSLEAVASYLPAELHDRLRYQPCPSTVLAQLQPSELGDRARDDDVLGVNLAFDRPSNRYEGQLARRLQDVASAIGALVQEGWRVRYVVHDPTDEYALPWLDRGGFPYEVVDLAGRSDVEIIEAYQSITVAVGMRGHSQMIPFGVGTPIISLVSHDKLRWFLDDIGHPEWAIELGDEDLRTSLYEEVMRCGNSLEARRTAGAEAQQQLWIQTTYNGGLIRDAIQSSRR